MTAGVPTLRGEFMSYVNWNESMSVSVEVIDRQHQELLRLLNELHDAMTQGHGNTVLREIIEGLIEYTHTHFKTEESYFEACDYPDCAAHKQQHRDFVVKVMDFKQGFDEGRLMLTIDVMSFLGDWLVEHIQGSDASYAPFLRAEGVA
jgi:hemerythrin